MGPLLVQVALVTSLAAVPMTGEVTSLAGSMKCVEDPSGVLTFAEVSAEDFQIRLKPSEKDIPNFGFTDSVYWCLSEVKNQTTNSQWVLELGYPLLDYVDLYLRYVDGNVIKHSGGDMLPFSERYRPHRTINFSAHLGSQEIVEIWFRVKTQSSMQLPVTVKSEVVFGDTASKEGIGFGFIYGGLLLIAFFNLVLFISLRDHHYLMLFVILFSSSWFFMLLNGVAQQYFLPNLPTLANKLLGVSCLICQLFIVLFSNSFLGCRSRLPRFHTFFTWFGRVLILGAVASLFVPYAWTIKFVVVNALVVIVSLLWAGAFAARIGFSSAKIFLASWFAWIFGSLIMVLKTVGILPSMFITDYGFQLGAAGNAVLLSLALADRVRMSQLERDVANQAMLQGYKALEHELNRRQDIQIENDQLLREMQKAKEQLTQADKLSSLGQLTAGVAHDIASPTGYIANARDEVAEELGVIRQTLDELVGDDPSAEAQELRDFFGQKFTHIDSLLGNMATGTDRIKAIHQAIRNYTRVDAEPETGQGLGPIVGEAVTILSSKLKAFHVVVELDGLPGVTCKRSQLGQVFANLLSNAADALQDYKDNHASEAFTGRIEVRGMSVRHGGFEGVAVRVEDNGPGIPADIRERIGEAFFTTKAVGKGTGLGMSICQRIVDAHGGKLGIGDSVELGGASMTVWLPLKPIEERVD